MDLVSNSCPACCGLLVKNLITLEPYEIFGSNFAYLFYWYAKWWENNRPKPHCRLYKLQVAQKRYTRFVAILREHICSLNTQSGSRSPLKRLFESYEEAVILEPFFRACLLPLTAPGAQGSLNGSQTVLGSQEAVFLDYIKRVSALQASLDY